MPAFAAAAFGILFLYRPVPTLFYFLPAAALPAIAYFATNYAAVGQLQPVQTEFESPWYLYEGSHWSKAKLNEGKPTPGIDFARTRESRAWYAFHLLLGHHGAFSLTPIFLLSLVGMLMLLPHVWPALFGNSKEEMAPRRGLTRWCSAPPDM